MNSARINYLAVIVAAVVYFFLGGAWFTYFSQAWLAGIGKTMAELQHSGVPPAVPYIIAFISNLVMAYLLALLAARTGHSSAGSGAKLGALLWVGLVATTFATEYAFEARSWQIFAINAGYPLAGLLIMGAIVGGWTKKSGADTARAASA